MLRRKFLVHITLLLFFLLLVEVNSFKPENREFHTATLIGNELYILGGRDFIAKSPSKDFFYLDVSKKFNTDKLPWIDLSKYNTNTTNTTIFVPPHFGAASAMGGVHNDTLFLYGGVLPVNTTKFVYVFDPNAKTWTTPEIDMKTIDNVNDTRKSQMTGIIDCNGKMYLWGGEVDGKSSKEMIILDTKKFTLNHYRSNNTMSRINYGAVLLPDQSIIYMGGFVEHEEDLFPLDSLSIFNTINNTWSKMHTSGHIPSERSGFSAILGPNNQIIIFGGSGETDGQIISPGDALYTLNLTNHRWKQIKASNAPSTRTGHKANLVGNYMIVSFGNGYSQTQEKDIILLEISGNKYKWTDTFNPSPTSSLSSPSSPPSHLTQSIQSTTSVNSSTTNSQPSVLADKLFNKPTLIGAIMGTMIGSSLLSFGGFMLYKRNKLLKRHQIDTLRISGSEDGNQIDRNTFIQRIRNSTHS